MFFGENTFSHREIEAFAEQVPKIIRAAWQNDDMKPLNVSLVGMGEEGARWLCAPIPPDLLNRIHRCSRVDFQDMNIRRVCIPKEEQLGILTFRVSYDFQGAEFDGSPLTVQVDGMVKVHCSYLRLGLSKKRLCISYVEGWKTDDPAMQEKSASPRESRAQARVKALDRSSCANGCIEAIFDLLGELFFN